MLTKSQLIDSIHQINRSASRDWLTFFESDALRAYLDHLQHTLEPRGGDSFWIRPAGASAAFTRGPT